MGQAADVLKNIWLKSPHRSEISREIINNSWICDITACFFLVAEISIYIKVFPMATVLNILGPLFATVLTLGIFQEICLTALKTQLIFKHMNRSIQVQFFSQQNCHISNLFVCMKRKAKWEFLS